MAVPLDPRCGLPIFLPPGFVGPLCRCATQAIPTPLAAPAPSPASTLPGSATQGTPPRALDGGSGPSERAAGSPGRGPEKGPQRSPGGQGGGKPPIPALTLSEADKDPAAVAKGVDWRAVESWFDAKFFVKGGIDSGAFLKLVGAAKAYGYSQEKDGGIRDYLRGLKEAGVEAASNKLAAILIKAGAIEAPKGG